MTEITESFQEGVATLPRLFEGMMPRKTHRDTTGGHTLRLELSMLNLCTYSDNDDIEIVLLFVTFIT